MNESLIDSIASRYARTSLTIILTMALLTLAILMGSAYGSGQMTGNIVISALFSLAAMKAYEAAWKSIAKSAPATLAKFYLAAPVLLMLAAVAVMLAFNVVHRGDTKTDGQSATRSAMLGFTAIFFSFYIVLMIFDCIYFSQVEKRNKI